MNVITTVRMPKDLHDKLKKSTKENQRSLNKEITFRLQQSYTTKQHTPHRDQDKIETK